MPFKRGDKAIFMWNNLEYDCEILEELPDDGYVVIFPEDSEYDYHERVTEICSKYLKLKKTKKEKIIITI